MTTFVDTDSSRPAANGPLPAGIAPEEEVNRVVPEAGEAAKEAEKEETIRAGIPASRHHKRASTAIPAPRGVARSDRRTADAGRHPGDTRRKLSVADAHARIAPDRRENRYTVYKGLVREAATAYGEMPPLARLRMTDPFTLLSHALVALGFAIWWQFMPKIRVVEVTVTGAYALEPKPIVHMALFTCLLMMFVVSLWASYFGKSQTADRAGTLSKALLGFFAGAATNYLALAN
jgi:hypothetical protein